MADGWVIRFRNVSFGYAGSDPLFRDLCLDLEAGTFYRLKGASGAGKSTFLRLMSRLEEPLAGELFLRGRPFRDYPPALLRRRVLYVQQTPVVLDASIRDNLLLPFGFRANRDLPRPGDDTLVRSLFRFRLGEAGLERNARNLSVGQQQRLCLIRGLLLSPEVVLLDEPTSALDDESAAVVESAAEELAAEQGKTVVMAHHRSFAPRVVPPLTLTLSGGGVSLSGNAQAQGSPGAAARGD
jgi:putative ABC transport system ATP-binding protein